MSKNIVEDSIKCLANMEIEETTYQVARNVVLDEIERLKIIEEKYKDSQLYIKDFKDEIERLNNIINRTNKYVESLSSSGRGCDIYDDIKQEILRELKGSDKK